MSRFSVVIALFLLVAFGGPAVASKATPAASPQVSPVGTPVGGWGCDSLSSYVAKQKESLYALDEVDDMRAIFAAEDFTTIRPSVALSASKGFDKWVSELQEIPVPPAAVEYNKAFINTYSTISSMLVSYANGGMFAMLPYQDALDAEKQDLSKGYVLGKARCGTQWTDVIEYPQ